MRWKTGAQKLCSSTPINYEKLKTKLQSHPIKKKEKIRKWINQENGEECKPY